MEPETQSRWISAERVLRCIWQHGAISRVGIARALGLNKATITAAAAELIQAGWIREIGQGPQGKLGGRKPVLLSIEGKAGSVIGIRVQPHQFKAVAVNLAGEILAESENEYLPQRNLDSVIQHACRRALEVFAPKGIPVFGFGIGLSALVDPARSLVIRSNPFALDRQVAIQNMYAAAAPLPIFIENDANCCALGELAFHQGRDLCNFLFALVELRSDPRSMEDAGGIGIGLGLVLGGRLHQGATNRAGEFRSILWKEGLRSQLSLGPDELRRLLVDSGVLAKVAEELSKHLAFLANTLDLTTVIIGGEIEQTPMEFPNILRRAIQANHLYEERPEVSVRYSSLGGLAVAYGAAGMAIDRMMAAGHFGAGGHHRLNSLSSSQGVSS